MKVLWLLAVALGLSLPLTAHAGVRWCHPGEADAADHNTSDRDIDSHRLFAVPAITYDRPPTVVAGLELRLVIDETGAVACVDDAYGQMHKVVASTPQRRALFKAIADWRYTPFELDGKPARVTVFEYPAETVNFNFHEDMPAAPLFSSTVTLDRTGCFGTCPDYKVTLHGDGRVDYFGNGFVDVPGTHHYHVSAGEVAALIERLRGRDIWSMAGSWIAPITDNPAYSVTLVVGGQRRVIRDYVGRKVGMPQAVTDSEDDIDAVAGSADWLHLSGTTLQRLKAEGFDFTSKAAADILATAVDNAYTTDNDAILSLIEAGAPIRGGHAMRFRDYGDEPAPSVLDMAIVYERDVVVDALIAHGALVSGGKPDQAQIDSAFGSAIRVGRLAGFQKFWAYHPALTFTSKAWEDGKTLEKVAPVTLELQTPDEDENGQPKPWDGFAIPRFLLDQGCDINASDADGTTLLRLAAEAGDPVFVKYLIDRGADINARTNDNETPLTEALDEDTAIVLLEAGADPYIKPDYTGDVFDQAEAFKLTKVQAWLDAHNLKPEPAG